MATFKASAFNKNAPLRPEDQYGEYGATMTISIPAGTALANNDILDFGKIGENVVVTHYELDFDKFDSNATAALKAKLGITASDACLLASTIVQTNTTGAKNLSGSGGSQATSGDFAVNPFPTQTTVQSLLATITQNAGTNYTTGTRNVTLRVKYQYAYADQFVSGVTSVSSTNLAGTKVLSDAVTYDYNGNAP
jgi:hypothetical protein